MVYLEACGANNLDLIVEHAYTRTLSDPTDEFVPFAATEAKKRRIKEHNEVVSMMRAELAASDEPVIESTYQRPGIVEIPSYFESSEAAVSVYS